MCPKGLSVKTMLCAACVRDAVVKHDPMQSVDGLRCMDTPVRPKWSGRPFPYDVVEVVSIAIVKRQQRADNVAMDVGTVISKRTANKIVRAIARIDRIIVDPIVDTFTESVANVMENGPPFVVR